MIKNKLIIVLGAGESGVGTAVLAAKQGFDVFVSDFGKIKDDYRNILITKTYHSKKALTIGFWR